MRISTYHVLGHEMISRVRPYFCDDSPYFNFCVVLFLIYSRDVTNRRSIIGWSVHDLI